MILSIEDFPFFWDTHDTSGNRKLALFPLQIIYFHYAGRFTIYFAFLILQGRAYGRALNPLYTIIVR